MAHHGPADRLPTEVDAVLQRVKFYAESQARHNLSIVLGRLPPPVTDALVLLLEDCPDPDAALNFFERLSEHDNGALLLMERHLYLVHYAVVVFASSQWLGETILQNPDLFHAFVRERGLDRVRSREDFRENFARVKSRSFETDMAMVLARFRRREYVRIMLRDLLGIATLAETTAEISALSDVLIEEALTHCDSALRKRYGTPQHIDPAGRVVETPVAVLSMGKLGGNELNYSSDIDLLYLYGDGAEMPGNAISTREYFVRLAQEVTGLLSRVTREGPVFRIDLRLRPQGAEGDPAVALGYALRYYSQTARDWEFQALIKVRHSAGDQALAREFIRGVQQYVYRGELNFKAIETALDALGRMKSRRQRKLPHRRAETIDVKMDRGGIRDIEFLVQCLQRVYGGTEPWLRSGGTLFSLQKLHDKNHISGKDYNELTSAYEFLRKVEHRLQLRAGQQTHRLPREEHDLRVLQRCVYGGAQDGREDLVADLRARMQAVAAIYNRIIHQEQQQSTLGPASELHLSAPVVDAAREHSYTQLLARLANDSPELHRLASTQEMSSAARRNLYRFLGAACTSSERYAAVVRAPAAVERAVAILDTSEYLTEILLRHPQEVATLETLAGSPTRSAQLFEQAGTSTERRVLDPVFEYAATASDREAMALLRRHYRHRVFVSGSRDVLQPRSIYDSLLETTGAADEAIRAAYKIAGSPARLAILALGRLGTREFDILSDADVLFVRDESIDLAASARAAERVVETLAAYTNEGSVFPVDARLRPHGTQGELVTTPDALSAYFGTEAQPWEAITYTKLRFVAGDETIGQCAIEAVDEQSARIGDRALLVSELREMRTRLEKTRSAKLDLKLSPGGLYDIDFILGFFALVKRIKSPGTNARSRLATLWGSGVLGPEQHHILEYGAELLRATEHAVRLVDGRARKSLPGGEGALQSTERLVSGALQRQFENGLEAELRIQMTLIRECFESLLG